MRDLKHRLREAAWATFVTILVSTLFASAPAKAWDASRHQEDWGPMCFLTKRAGLINIGFYAAPGDAPLAMIEGAVLPEEATVTWIVDDAIAVTVNGTQNDYFGWHEFTVTDARLLDALRLGHTLRIAIDGGRAMELPLAGSANAIDNFKACLDRT